MQQLKSTAAYEKIAATQRENDLAPDTQKGYLSKMKVMTIILNGTDLRHEFLELDESGNALRYFGRAAKVLQLKMPLSVRAGKVLFAALSVSSQLARPKDRPANGGNDASQDLTKV